MMINILQRRLACLEIFEVNKLIDQFLKTIFKPVILVRIICR